MGARAVQALLRCPHAPRSDRLSLILAGVSAPAAPEPRARHLAMPVADWGVGALRVKRAGPHIKIMAEPPTCLPTGRHGRLTAPGPQT
jgi:hypothetical protein